MAKLKVLICDDREEEATDAERNAKSGAGNLATIKSLHGKNLTDAIRGVTDAARAPANKKLRTAFDDYDLVICDDNLSHLDDLNVLITAESIIGNIRAYSRCGYIVSLNKRKEVDFDLESLFGDPGSKADLAINKKHLRIKALWGGGTSGDFAPWYWPCLVDAAKLRRKQVTEVERNLDKQVLRHFGFTKKSTAALSDGAIGALTPSGVRNAATLSRVTFRNLFRDSARTLPSDMRAALMKHRRTDAIARVVASELDTWLRRYVLAPQDVLVDVPHLLARMPVLFGRDATGISSWNSALATTSAPYGMSPTLYKKHLVKRHFKAKNWLQRPAFWWPEVGQDRSLSQLLSTQVDHKWGDFVFCEDTRKFKDRAPTSKEPQSFKSDLGGPWVRRYVERVSGFNYAPGVCFAR